MNYAEYVTLLQRPEWKQFAEKIKREAGNRCKYCGNYKPMKKYELAVLPLYLNSYVTRPLFIHLETGNSFHGFISAKIRAKLKDRLLVLFNRGRDELNIEYVNPVGMREIRDDEFKKFYEYYKTKTPQGWQDLFFKNDGLKKRWMFFEGLNVHHLYYQDGMLPWEYPREALVTLCQECHFEWHQDNLIQYRNKEGKVKGQLEICSKCKGNSFGKAKKCDKCGNLGMTFIT
jgi:hypothetical protein